MHHKRKRPKNTRAGCLMCKPHKANGVKNSFNAQTHQEKLARIDEQEQREVFEFNTLTPEDLKHSKEVIETNRFCYRHGVSPCSCRKSTCCSKYTHGCSPMNHKFFDPNYDIT